MSYTSTNPRAATNPLRSVVWNKPASQVLGWIPAQVATFELGKARRDVSALTEQLQDLYRSLGEQNAVKNKVLRRLGQAAVFRSINKRRAMLRAARRALAATELALLSDAVSA